MVHGLNGPVRKIKRGVASRRTPKKPIVYLNALNFASVLLGHEPGRVGDADSPRVLRLAHELDRAAHFYHTAALKHAVRKIRRGRPQNMADIAFIYAMGAAWKSAFGAPRFRKYQNARVTRGERGGKERPTIFQDVCNTWMKTVDPDRPKPLTPAAFKEAGGHLKRRQQ